MLENLFFQSRLWAAERSGYLIIALQHAPFHRRRWQMSIFRIQSVPRFYSANRAIFFCILQVRDSRWYEAEGWVQFLSFLFISSPTLLLFSFDSRSCLSICVMYGVSYICCSLVQTNLWPSGWYLVAHWFSVAQTCILPAGSMAETYTVESNYNVLSEGRRKYVITILHCIRTENFPLREIGTLEKYFIPVDTL